MKRIADLDPTTLNAEQRGVYEAIASGPRAGVRGPLAVWLHRPGLADRAQQLGAYCRYGSSLPPRLSELAILMMGRHWDAEYEWAAHKPIALQAGISPAVVEAIRTGMAPPFTNDDEALVHAFVTALHARHAIDDALYARAVQSLGEGGVVDLVGIAGYYTLISMTIKVFDLAPPDGAVAELLPLPS